jgi:hypothetical protein
MHTSWISRIAMLATVLLAGSAPFASAQKPQPKIDTTVMSAKLLSQMVWADDPTGAKVVVLYGDPSKPGWYIILAKWEAHKMSHPHYHANDRYITVVSGTWWVGAGTKFDPDSTVPMPPGSFVTHFAKKIHYDGAKDGDVILQIVGEGPATSIPAEVK